MKNQSCFEKRRIRNRNQRGLEEAKKEGSVQFIDAKWTIVQNAGKKKKKQQRNARKQGKWMS
jgi:hypothetical protein